MPATGATRTSYLSVLRNRYLAAAQKAIYTRCVLLERLQKRRPGEGFELKDLPRGQGFGKAIVFPIHTQENDGIGWRAGHQGSSSGYLPTPGSQGYVEATLSVKHMYGGFQLDGELLDADRGVGAAALKTLDSEMKGLPLNMRRRINIGLFGNGSGIEAYVTATSSGTTITLDSVRNMWVNRNIVVAAAADGTGAVARTITAVDEANKQITVNSSTSVTSASAIFGPGIYNTNVSEVFGNAITGLAGVIATTGTYAGLDRTQAANAALRSVVMTAPEANSIVDTFEQMFWNLEARNAQPSIVVCDHNVWKKFGQLYFGLQNWQTNIKKIEAGYPAFDFHGIPVTRDRACQEWTAYFLDERTLALAEERPLSIRDEDGAELQRVYDANGRVDAYEASFCARLELICNHPGGQGKLTITPT